MNLQVVNFAKRAQVAIDFSGLKGSQLRAAMAAAGCELSENHCYKLIRGEIRNPRYDTVAALIAATGVTPGWFFDADIGDVASLDTLARYLDREGASDSLARPHIPASERDRNNDNSNDPECD